MCIEEDDGARVAVAVARAAQGPVTSVVADGTTLEEMRAEAESHLAEDPKWKEILDTIELGEKWMTSTAAPREVPEAFLNSSHPAVARFAKDVAENVIDEAPTRHVLRNRRATRAHVSVSAPQFAAPMAMAMAPAMARVGVGVGTPGQTMTLRNKDVAM